MITLSNGHSFEYMAASGALAYDGRGWWWEQWLRLLGLFNTKQFTAVTKTLTFEPTRGNLRWYKPWTCIRFISDGVVNAVALTNPGYEWWCRKVGPRIDRKKQAVIVSLTGTDIEQIKVMAAAVSKFDIVAIQLNARCPNTDLDSPVTTEFVVDACYAIKTVSSVPLSVKVSVRQDVTTIVHQTAGLIAFFDINGVDWPIIFPTRTSPLAKYGTDGAVSGKVAHRETWKLALQIRNMTDVPVVGPVWNYQDITELRGMGIMALSFGSIFLKFPWKPTLYTIEDRLSTKHFFRGKKIKTPDRV